MERVVTSPDPYAAIALSQVMGSVSSLSPQNHNASGKSVLICFEDYRKYSCGKAIRLALQNWSMCVSRG